MYSEVSGSSQNPWKRRRTKAELLAAKDQYCPGTDTTVVATADEHWSLLHPRWTLPLPSEWSPLRLLQPGVAEVLMPASAEGIWNSPQFFTSIAFYSNFGVNVCDQRILGYVS